MLPWSLTLPVWLLLAPTPVLVAPGDQTEPRWSPDGSQVAYQQADREGQRVAVVALADGAVRLVAGGDGTNAGYPCWTPDGAGLVYAVTRYTGSAASGGVDGGMNLEWVRLAGGPPETLTRGRQRCLTACFSPDGQRLLFSSTHGIRRRGIGIAGLPWPSPAGALPELLVGADEDRDIASSQPAVSPDGQRLAFGEVRGIRGNWRVWLTRTAAPEDRIAVTPPDEVFCNPRWHPTRPWLLMSGYRPGDPGWSLYVMELPSRALLRLETGPGNARDGDWSPSGDRIVYAAKASDAADYDLFVIDAPDQLPPAPAEAAAAGPLSPPTLAYRFDPRAGLPAGLTATMPAPEPRGEGYYFGPGQHLSLTTGEPLAFGSGPFSVRVTFQVESHQTEELRHLAVGDYPDNPLGWQVYLGADGRVLFNSRDPHKLYRGTASDRPVPTGCPVTAIGVRDEAGIVRLFVDGLLQDTVAAGATIAYPAARQLRIGSQFNGSNPAEAVILEVSLWDRALTAAELEPRSLREWWAN